jgi:hypothetical protein
MSPVVIRLNRLLRLLAARLKREAALRAKGVLLFRPRRRTGRIRCLK